MTNLKHLLRQPVSVIPNKLTIAMLLVALAGFADAVYLTIEHYQNRIPPCSIGGCEQVLTSVYSVVWGVPVSLIGSIYYLTILIGLFAYFESKNTKILKWTIFLTVFGFGSSLWFLFLQIFVIHSYCLYCMISAITSTTLFVCACWIFSKHRYTPQLLQ